MNVKTVTILSAEKENFKPFSFKDDISHKLEFKFNGFTYEILYDEEVLGYYKLNDLNLLILNFLEVLAEFNHGDSSGVKARLDNLIEDKKFANPFQLYPTMYKNNTLKYVLGLEDNMIKSVCIEQNLTYQQLADMLGLSESSLRSAASTNKVSKQVEKSIEMYLKIVHLEKELEKSNEIKATLKSWLS